MVTWGSALVTKGSAMVRWGSALITKGSAMVTWGSCGFSGYSAVFFSCTVKASSAINISGWIPSTPGALPFSGLFCLSRLFYSRWFNMYIVSVTYVTSVP